MGKAATSIHDRTFYELMSHRDFVMGIFQMSLPMEIQEKLDWNSLKLYKLDGKHVRSDLKQESRADLAYTCMLEDQLSFFTLHIEHQSKAHPLMPIRLGYLSRKGRPSLLDFKTGLNTFTLSGSSIARCLLCTPCALVNVMMTMPV